MNLSAAERLRFKHTLKAERGLRVRFLGPFFLGSLLFFFRP
jgi:hypothetical protein